VSITISRLARAVADALAAACLAMAGAPVVLVCGLVLRVAPRRPTDRLARRIVYLGTGQIAQVFPRNGVNLFLQRECSDFDGFFEQLWNVHFPAGATGALDLTPRHHLLDIDFALNSAPGPLTRTAWRELRFLLWLLPFLVRTRASVVTATNPFLQGLNAAIAARLLGLPYGVIITRDYDWDWATLRKQAFGSVYRWRPLERAIGQWVLRHAQLVLADREYYRQFAVRNGAAPHRAIATRVLADTAYAEACRRADVSERYGLQSRPLLMYVGRLDPDKFALDLVDCLARVHRRYPSAVLVCAGTGSLSSTLSERAAELGLAANLRLLGSVDLADLPDLVASCDVVVAPHMGYTLVEAGLTGVPIVTYDYDFHGEIIHDRETGRLVPLRDVQGLADAVLELLDAPEDGTRMGARLRQKLLEEHSLAAVVPLYRDAYARALDAAA
jgi:glycosyltransferase involved in cell wall biosynthesis